MAWLNDWKARDGLIHYRLLDRVNGKQVTVIRNLGTFEPFAQDMKTYYRKAKTMGFVFTPPTTVATIEGFLKAKAEGRDFANDGHRLPIGEMCDLYLKIQGPALKGGVNDHYKSAYYGLRLRMNQVKAFWKGKYADEITKINVREFLAQFKTVGTRMRQLGAIGAMFRAMKDWNEEGNILPARYRLPSSNPFTKWRTEMKPAEKRELPDKRVLTHEEWAKLWKNLPPRARAICEIALARFLRISDIEGISRLAIVDGQIKGVQKKTGDPFTVPVMADQPTKYDFTNFHRQFTNAQIKAGLFYPADHPLHFTVKDLRRTGATWAYRESKDIRTIQKMLGHRNMSTTERYLNITDADTTAIAKTMDSLAAVKINAPNENRTRISSLRGTRPDR